MISAKAGRGGPKTGYVPQVDGLRALAALAVVFFHEGNLPYGWGGVWVFFVISGFVITRMMIASRWSLSAGSYWNFSLRRIARIWPLYFLYIGVGLLLLPLSDNGFAGGWLEVAGLVTFTRNFVVLGTSFTHIFSHLWSISVEQQFYLIYPFLFAVAARAKNPIVLLGSVLVGCFVVRSGLAVSMLMSGAEPEAVGRFIYLFSIGHFDAFMVGAIAAFYPERLVRLRGALSGLAAAMVLLAFAVALGGIDYAALPDHSFRSVIEATRATLGIHPYEHGAMIWCYGLLVLVAAALLAQALGPDGLVKRALGWRPLVWAGQISFGIYVWQGLVSPAFYKLAAVNPHTASLPVRVVTMLLYLTLLIGVASASYYLFERRFHNRIGIKRPQPAPAATLSESDAPGADAAGHAASLATRSAS